MLVFLQVAGNTQNYYYNYRFYDNDEAYQTFGNAGYITFDTAGLAWIGGNNGLYRFDGTHFKHYRHESGNSSDIPFNDARFNYQDKRGNYWVYVSNYGLYHFLPENGNFEKVRYKNESEFDIHNYELKLPFEDSQGRLWFLVADYGLALWDQENNQFKPYKLCEDGSCGTYKSISWVNHAIEDKNDNTLWIASNDGLIHFYPTTGKFRVYRLKPLTGIYKNIERNIFINLYFDNDGILWCGTWARGIAKFNTETNAFTELRWNNKLANTVNICNSVTALDNSHLLINTLDSGMMVFDKYKRTFERIKKPGNEKEYVYVSIMCRGAENVIWAIANNKLMRVNVNKSGLQYYPLPSVPERPMVFLKNKKELFFATWYYGHFYRYDFETGAAIRIPLDAKADDETVNDIKADEKNKIWLASKAGVFIYDAQSRKVKRFPIRLPSNDTNIRAFSILHDTLNSHWIATSRGLINCDDKGRILKIFTSGTGLHGKLKTNRIESLSADKNGNIWFGSNWAGLGCYIRKTDSIRYFSFPGIPKNYNVLSICQTDDGKITFSIERVGIGVLSAPLSKQEKFELRGSDEIISSGNINYFIKSGTNNFWMFTTNGLAWYNPITNKSVLFNEKDGLMLNYIESIGYQDTDGNIYIGGSGGFQIIREDSLLSRRPLTGKLFVSSFSINGKEYFISANSKAPLHLSHRENNIDFKFSALTPSLRGDFRYSYKLAGADKNWNYTRTGSGKYSLLPAGNYSLQVKAEDRHGNQILNDVLVPFIIFPPWYQTWWFYTLCALAVSGVLYWIYRYRINHLVKVQKMRLQIAGDLHDDIGSSLSSLAFNSELIRMNLRSENGAALSILEKMDESSRNMVNSLSEIVWFINPKNDSAESFIRRLKFTSLQLLENRNIQFEFVESGKLETLHLDMRQRKNILLIFKEAIHNAIKYSDCNNISLNVSYENKILEIRLTDDGKGFNTNVDFDGNGITNMKGRAEELKADISICSTESVGTAIVFRVKIT